jgi:hypothetical protein
MRRIHVICQCTFNLRVRSLCVLLLVTGIMDRMPDVVLVIDRSLPFNSNFDLGSETLRVMITR